MQTTTRYRYQLDGSNGEAKKKTACPYCRQKKCFTRYKDYETNEYLDDSVGMCDRGNKCGEHVKPKDFFSTNPNKRPKSEDLTEKPVYEEKPPINIPISVLQATLNDYENNSFINALQPFFSVEQLEKAIGEYFIGTTEAGFSKEAKDSKPAVFWFIDRRGKIRAGQVKLFTDDCHTAKYIDSEGDKRNYQTWMHSLLKKGYQKALTTAPEWLTAYIESPNKVSCLWGEHLLSQYPSKPVAIVEAPKTAFIASMRYQQYVWLATTSLNYLTKQRCKVLKGRKVVLFPDAGIPNPRNGKTCYQLWQERIEEFKDIADFAFSALLEENATDEEKEKGFDLADYILKALDAAPLEISSNDIAQIPVDTRTGRDFGFLIMATAWMKTGQVYDILFDKDGELITKHEKLQALSAFFNKSFLPAKLDGVNCLVNIVNNSSYENRQ